MIPRLVDGDLTAAAQDMESRSYVSATTMEDTSIPQIMAEEFPTGRRATGIRLPYGLTVSVFGGTAPHLAAATGHAGQVIAYSAYTAFASVVSLCFLARRRAEP